MIARIGMKAPLKRGADDDGKRSNFISYDCPNWNECPTEEGGDDDDDDDGDDAHLHAWVEHVLQQQAFAGRADDVGRDWRSNHGQGGGGAEDGHRRYTECRAAGNVGRK